MTVSSAAVLVGALVLVGLVVKVAGSLIRLAVTGAMLVLGVGVFLWARAEHPHALDVFGTDPWHQAGGLIACAAVALVAMDLLVGGREPD